MARTEKSYQKQNGYKKKDMTMTGGGPPIDIQIDDDIAGLIDPKELDGHIEVPDPEIVFGLVDEVILKESPEIPIPVSPKSNSDSQKPITIETVMKIMMKP